MTDLTTLRDDLSVMLNYRGWFRAIANNAKKDLSEEWNSTFNLFIERTIRILDRMIRQCEFYIEIGEGIYEKDEE